MTDMAEKLSRNCCHCTSINGYPIIEDLSMEVANAYGMIQPGASDTSAVRAVFVIDPEGILRAMLYYPMSNGRSVEVILRLVKALQTSDKHQIATPEGWQTGEKVIVPPPSTAEAADARTGEVGYDCVDWYFCKRDITSPSERSEEQLAYAGSDDQS